MITELLIVVSEYLSGRIDVEHLEAWIAPRLPILYVALQTEPAPTLLDEVVHGLAVLGAGHMTEDEFKELLQGALMGEAQRAFQSSLAPTCQQEMSMGPMFRWRPCPEYALQ